MQPTLGSTPNGGCLGILLPVAISCVSCMSIKRPVLWIWKVLYCRSGSFKRETIFSNGQCQSFSSANINRLARTLTQPHLCQASNNSRTLPDDIVEGVCRGGAQHSRGKQVPIEFALPGYECAPNGAVHHGRLIIIVNTD